jgi:WhiB family transcriptional regulator, redox-sensing transcriptional regulator
VNAEGVPESLSWMHHARCRGLSPSLFFPPDGEGVQAARPVCGECPVRVQCLEFALANDINNGVWGGTSERERRRILRRRNRSQPTTTI